MTETLADLQAKYAEWQIVLDRVVKGRASQSAGDRSWSNHAPETIQRMLDHLRAQMDALTRGPSFGTTVARARRGR